MQSYSYYTILFLCELIPVPTYSYAIRVLSLRKLIPVQHEDVANGHRRIKADPERKLIVLTLDPTATLALSLGFVLHNACSII